MKKINMTILKNTELYYLAKELSSKYPGMYDISWMSDIKVENLEFWDISKLKERININRILKNNNK